MNTLLVYGMVERDRTFIVHIYGPLSLEIALQTASAAPAASNLALSCGLKIPEVVGNCMAITTWQESKRIGGRI